MVEMELSLGKIRNEDETHLHLINVTPGQNACPHALILPILSTLRCLPGLLPFGLRPRQSNLTERSEVPGMWRLDAMRASIRYG